MTLTNQLDRAHRNQLRDTSAKIQLCKSGGSESCGEHRVTAWVISQYLRLPAGEGSGWIFEESEETIWVNTHKACHLNKTCHLEGKNMATLPYTFPEVSCYSVAVFPKGFNDWTWTPCYSIDERLAFHSATDRPQHKMETDVTGTCSPVPLVFPCPLPFELFLPPTVVHKRICLSEKKQISSNFVQLEPPWKGRICWMPLAK